MTDQTNNPGRFRIGERRATTAGRKGRWASPWNDRNPAEHRRHKRLELIKRLALRKPE